MSETTNPLKTSDATRSLTTLGERLRRVEEELDLECSNLRDLVSSKDPDVNRQLDSLGTSIAELHESLSEVRTLLEGLPADNAEVRQATEQAIGEPSSQKEKKPLDMTPQQIGRQRHDEKITLGGIFRAMLMADEPEQRANSRTMRKD